MPQLRLPVLVFLAEFGNDQNFFRGGYGGAGGVEDLHVPGQFHFSCTRRLLEAIGEKREIEHFAGHQSQRTKSRSVLELRGHGPTDRQSG